MEKLLHLFAQVAVRHSEELKQYYQRKMTDGKHSMSVLKTIRNKVVLRAVTVIDKQKPNEDKNKKTA